MDYRKNIHSTGKKVYFINGKSFFNDKNTRNGMKKAEEYCYENMLNTKDIIVFDSVMESKYYMLLKKLESEGKVKNIEIHKNFLLLPEFISASGTYHDKEIYEADFVYYNACACRQEVVDVKGYREDVFDIKWKQFDYKFKDQGLSLKVVQLKSGKGVDYLDENNWVNLVEIKTLKKRVEKLKEENKELKNLVKIKQKEDSAIKRLKARREELLKKAKLTKAEQKRLNTINETLKEKGIMI